MADSYYEYLLKAWVQGGQHKGELLLDTGKRWEMAMDDMITYLVRRSKNSTSLADVHGSLDMAFSTSLLTMNHLSCFVPGSWNDNIRVRPLTVRRRFHYRAGPNIETAGNTVTFLTQKLKSRETVLTQQRKTKATNER